MLSLSADITESDVDLGMINGDKTASAGDIQHGSSLLNFAEAFASRDDEVLAAARETLLAEAGADVLVDTAGVAANFQRMVRIADSTGIPLDERNAVLGYGVIQQLNLERFKSAENTPPGGLKRKMLSWVVRPMARRKIRKMAEQRSPVE
jgi:hypothetical protein